MKRTLTFVCAALILSVMAFSETKTVFTHAESAMPPAPEQVTAVPLYWLSESNRPANGYYLYTINHDEATMLAQNAPWDFQGIAGYVFPKQVPGAVPLYQVLKTEFGDMRIKHFYTIDKSDADNAVKGGWQDLSIACYIAQTKMPGTVPFHILYNPGGDVYFYTMDEQLVAHLVHLGFQLSPKSMYIWQKPTTLDIAKPIPPRPGPMSPMDQLFSLGCSQDAAKKQISCPSVRGWDTCNFYKNKGELKVSFCTTTVDQFAFANIETDLTSRSCTRFLGRAGEYLCQTLNGDQACQSYLKKKDGLVTKCLSVKQGEMEKDLSAHGCKSFLGRADDFYCTTEGMKTCENYRLDGRVKTCRPPKQN